jgi:hypothetical protein
MPSRIPPFESDLLSGGPYQVAAPGGR